MIIAKGSVDINEATKLAQDASDSASDLADKMKNTVATMDGKTTVSSSTPFNDGKEHNEGDMWTVINDDVASAMYIYTSGEWKAKKWDQQALSVKQLSALTADLGHVTAGTLESAKITGSTITGTSISDDTNTGYHYWLDYNGFHVKNDGIGDTWVFGGLIDVGGTMANPNVMISADGIYSSSKRISTNSMTMSAGSVFGVTNGVIYFEQGDGSSGGSPAEVHTGDIHAKGDVYSGSTKLKSALSAKRDVTEYSPDEALSAVMNTDVKKWKYKDSDNSADSQHIGPIIDDVNSIGKKSASIANDMISTDENGDYYLNESNTISILLAALKKSNQRIDELSYRIAQLERKNAQ